MSHLILIPISWGELLDKISILEIKLELIADESKKANVSTELALLNKVRDQQLPNPLPVGYVAMCADLKAINQALWKIEDDIRDCERSNDFGPVFVQLARSVYRQNDRRAQAKRALNEALGSQLVEEKSYQPY